MQQDHGNPTTTYTNSVMTRIVRRLQNPHGRKHAHRNAWLIQCTLVTLIVCFVVFNVRYAAERKARLREMGKLPQQQQLRSSRSSSKTVSGQWITDTAQPFNENEAATRTHHLIMVAGHSVTVSGHLEDADKDEQDWFLLKYQQHRGLPQAIVGHIRAGIQQAAKDSDSLLLFSGGETRDKTGPETESSSYYRVADAMKLWGPASSNVRARTITEEFATDSFENLLFSICRFYEITGHYPSKITVVSFTFKRQRFENIHAPALQWPAHRFHYVGVDPPASTGFDLEEATQGEVQNAAKPFETDPYGCNSKILQDKRKSRNPFSRIPPYELSCPDMKELLHHCGPGLFPKHKLPWRELE